MVEESLCKIYSPKNQTNKKDKELITFIHTYNPNHDFNLRKVTNCMEEIQDKKLKEMFKSKRILATRRNNTNLKQMLTSAKFEMHPLIKQPVMYGVYPCNDNKCHLHTKGYITACTSFQFKPRNKIITWKYNRMYTCSSKNVIYMLVCTKDTDNYIGQTEELRPCSNNSKSMVRNAENYSQLYPLHFKRCSDGKEPYLLFPYFYVDDNKQREFMERRFIKKYKPILNGKR